MAPGEQVAALRKMFALLMALTAVNFLATIIAFVALGFAVNQRAIMNDVEASQNKLKILYMALSDTESSQRGYIITGDDRYEAAYKTNVGRAKSALADVEKIKTSPADAATLDQVVALSQKKLAEMQSTLEVRKKEGLSAAAIQVGMHLGANLMTENRQKISVASAAMDLDIREKRSTTVAVSSFAISTLIVNVLTTIGAAMACYGLFKRLQDSNQELLKLNQTKEEFLALASHQLRTPATAVKQYLSLSLDGFAGELTPTQRDMVEKARVSNERQINIVNDILKITKLDLNKLTLTKKPHNLSTIARHAARDMRATVKNTKHTLAVRAPRAKIYVDVDEFYIHSVIENLIDNAIKYSPPGSAVDVVVRTDSDMAVLEVIDRGVGIAPEDHARLFRKFERLDNPLSVIAGGTGLGLYWCKEIVELHGGSITIESEKGQGSNFIVRLPKTTRHE